MLTGRKQQQVCSHVSTPYRSILERQYSFNRQTCLEEKAVQSLDTALNSILVVKSCSLVSSFPT